MFVWFIAAAVVFSSYVYVFGYGVQITGYSFDPSSPF